MGRTQPWGDPCVDLEGVQCGLACWTPSRKKFCSGEWEETNPRGSQGLITECV